MESANIEMVQIEIEDLIVTVDRETAQILQTGKFNFIWKMTSTTTITTTTLENNFSVHSDIHYRSRSP